jgi:phosphatidylserine decarboxylase
MKVVSKRNIEGLYLSVSEKTLIKKKKIYEKNARVCLEGRWEGGAFWMILVGAMNVGKIIIREG